jgi:hypothetical protein
LKLETIGTAATDHAVAEIRQDMSGRLIGNYRIVDYIGSGGFGSVFRAEDVNTPGRVVAIKELHKKHTRNAVIKQRFFQEAVAMARLDHPNLPRLFTFGEDNGSYYLVMEFIAGRLLTDEIQEKGAVEPSRAVSIITQVLEAVSYAHTNGIIHRDLKPDNIMLMTEAGLRVRVLDFGIARMVGGENLTLTGEGFGTPAYMSPERITGASAVDHRTDIYSLGIILVEMLTGKPPFQSRATDPAAYWFEMRKLHESEQLPPLTSLGVARELEAVIRRAAGKRPEDRYQTADEMLAELRSLAGDVMVTQTEPPKARLSMTTAPGGAEVLVDEIRRGVSDGASGKITIDGLEPGLHAVRVMRSGYDDYQISVSLEGARQTDLQVALAARATVAMPNAEYETAAADFKTRKIDTGEDAETALLVMDSLPVGSTVFVGTRAVALADANGRATLNLQPGIHELQVSAPSGGIGKQVVTVTDEDTGSLKQITVPMTKAVPTSATTLPAGTEPSQTRKRLALLAVALLLVGLAAASYFALRGPSRDNAAIEASATLPPAPPPTSENPPASTPSEPATKEAAADTKKEKEETSQSKAQKESEKSETRESNKSAVAVEPARPPAVDVPTPQPPDPAKQTQQTAPQDGEACLGIVVTNAAGKPVSGARISLALETDSGYNGQTNQNGRWVRCGLTAGQRGKAVGFGPGGAVVASRGFALTAGRNFIAIQVGPIPGRVYADPDGDPTFRPKRRAPFRRRPY